MNHDGAAQLIGDLMRGNLAEPTESRVLTHVATCDECRSLSKTYLTLSQAYLGPDAAGSDSHPSSDSIIEYAFEMPGLDAAGRARIVEHIKTCPTCALEVETARSANTDVLVQAPAGPGTSHGDRRRSTASWMPVAAAAMIVAALLGYPAWLGLFGNETEVPWQGPVRLSLIRPPLRSSVPEVAEVVVKPGQPYVPLAVDVPLLASPEVASFRFAVLSIDGASVWSGTFSREQIQDDMGRSSVLTLLLPGSALPAGEYRLQVFEGGDESDPMAFEAPMVVSASD